MIDGAPAWLPARGFDDFKLLRPLGRGGMGVVWLGHDQALDRPVALKFLPDHENEVARERLIMEARALARLQHPNVAAVYRVGTVDGHPYIASEFVDGESLDLIERPVPWRRVLELGLGVARGLAAAHAHGVLHRDVKPSNIMLSRSGEPKLIDFGLAKLRPRDVNEGLDPAQSITAGSLGGDVAATRGGHVAGTPLYMAPERWEGAGASESSDVYALGLVLYELLAGALPHAKLPMPALVMRVTSVELPDLAALCPEVPPALRDLVARMTRIAPHARTGSAREVCDSLSVIRALFGAFVEQDAAPTPTRERLLASMREVTARMHEFGAHFYGGLFQSDPDLRPLFPADLGEQHQKLVQALQLAVERLENPSALVPLLEDLGRRHRTYGAVPEHFEAVGHQLLASLEHISGPWWDDELRRAWAVAYERMAHVMVRGMTRPSAVSDLTAELVPPTDWNLPVGPAVTRYARHHGISIAYQTLGSSGLDLVVVPGFVSHLEVAWELPEYAAFLRRLSSFAHVVVLDRRGTGMSDRVQDDFSIDEQVGDVCAVLDAVGMEHALVLGLSGGSTLALALAALRPERVRGLALYGAAARALRASDYPQGLDPAILEYAIAQVHSGWGEPLFVEGQAPSRSGDPEFRRFWARYLRLGASPGVAEVQLRAIMQLDVRPILPHVHAPCLVLHREGDRMMPLVGARELASQLPRASLQTLPGNDHVPFVGDIDPFITAVHGFVSSLRSQPSRGTELRFASVVVVDGGVDAAAVGGTVAEVHRRYGALEVEPSDALPSAFAADYAGAMAAVQATLEITARLRGRAGRVSAAVVGDAMPRARARVLAQGTADGYVQIDPLVAALVRGGGFGADAVDRLLGLGGS